MEANCEPLGAGRCSPNRYSPISSGIESPSRTLISAREEYEASFGRTGERRAALAYPRGSVPVVPL